MIKKIIAFEIIYLNILLKKYLKSFDKKIQEVIFSFLGQNTFFDKKTFYIADSLLSEMIDLNNYSAEILNNKNNSEIIQYELRRLSEILDIFILKYSEPVEEKEIYLEKLKKLSDYLSNYDNKLFDHLEVLASFLYDHINKNGVDYDNNNLYQFLTEFLEMLEKSNQIVFNSKIIDKKFKLYFDILDLKPQNIIFLNNDENIKIIQDLLPSEILNKCFFNLGLKEHLIMNNQFFILEMHEKHYKNKKYSVLFSHEMGHLLDINIFDFNSNLLNAFYSQNSNMNFVILQRWLNELIADNIAFSLDGNNYIKLLEEFDEIDHDYIYPPNWLRLYMLDPNYPIKDYKTLNYDLQVIITQLLPNRDLLKNTLKIVTN